MSKVIIAHAHCVDGFTAAWAAREAEDDEVIFAEYDRPPPDGLDGRDVVIVDFSYPRDVLDDLYQRCASLLVLDHHATAAEALKGAPYAIFDMNRSGATMAWDHFHAGQARPALVEYVEDRDLWRHALPHSKEINAYIRETPRTWKAWDRLCAELALDLGLCEVGGRVVLRTVMNFVQSEVERAMYMRITDLAPRGDGCVEGVAVCGPPQYASDTCDELLKAHPWAAFAASWHMGPDCRWKVTLRSREGELNVAEVARWFGGGGHPHAAGFYGLDGVTLLPLKDRPSARS